MDYTPFDPFSRVVMTRLSPVLLHRNGASERLPTRSRDASIASLLERQWRSS
jgi:hypothetical protein